MMANQESPKKTSIDILEIKMSQELKRKYQISERKHKSKRSFSPIRKYSKYGGHGHQNKTEYKIRSKERIEKEEYSKDDFVYKIIEPTIKDNK